jgi:hypothetical protein
MNSSTFIAGESFGRFAPLFGGVGNIVIRHLKAVSLFRSGITRIKNYKLQNVMFYNL